MLASHTRLYVPAGRNNPVVLNRADGKRIRVVSGQGGTYALLTGDSLVFGPGKTGTLGFVESNRGDQLASFKGNHMIVTPEMSYLQGDTHLSALDRQRYLQLARERRTLANQPKSDIGGIEKTKSTSVAKRQMLQKQLTELGQSIDKATTEMGECFPWQSSLRAAVKHGAGWEDVDHGGTTRSPPSMPNRPSTLRGKDGGCVWTGWSPAGGCLPAPTGASSCLVANAFTIN